MKKNVLLVHLDNIIQEQIPVVDVLQKWVTVKDVQMLIIALNVEHTIS